MMKRRKRILLFLAAMTWACAAGRPAATGADAPAAAPRAIPVDDVAAARLALDEARQTARSDRTLTPTERAWRLIDLGRWPEAESVIADAKPSPELDLAAAHLSFKQHRYQDAESRVARLLAAAPRHRGARLMEARLQLQAWELPAAAATAQGLLDEQPQDGEAALLLGRIRLLEKKYDEALAWARRVQAWNPRSAGAYLLEADVRFWDQDPAGAEPPLVRALELDPFNADARFSYGYAIWRRVDATQLDAMAAQWKLALEIDPLHYVTHWHWGNGHTNLTYADYVHPTDSLVRERLEEPRALIAGNRVERAIELTRAVEREFPASVLPAMLRGSAYYMATELDRAARLDSAQATFTAILARKQNYGPAHNGLAAVIKQRQFTYLESNDSLEAVIASTPLPADPVFDAVFEDVKQYPGDRVRKMARRQLGPSIAYLPLLHRLGRKFTIPPLHVDLAEAQRSPGLRTATTFDNRQWMDIRGVGGGSAAIEYVERGSHWERNVLVHEYVHLFHGQVLSDAENRRVRELYHTAMREGRTLDYYAANNESEFLAQAYEAYTSPVKAHPLNHKAMNTHDDLRRKDPATYAFVDSLVARQNAYLAGDAQAFESNWAQAYVGLSERARRGGEPAERLRSAAALLDSALVRDPAYLPAQLSYAALLRDHGRYEEAERRLAGAEARDPGYAPIYRARAELVAARAAAGKPDPARALDEQVALYRKALELESDLAVRAQLNSALRTLYLRYARIPEAIRVAEEYVASAPTISTYLRDRRDEAAAFANELKSSIGHAEATLPFFAKLVGLKPQHYEHRKQYADALAAAGRFQDALATLEEAQRILQAAGAARADYMVQTADIQLLRGDSAAAIEAIRPILEGRARIAESDPRLLRVLAALGEREQVEKRVRGLVEGTTPAARAEAAFTRGWIAERRGERTLAERAYREALQANPYHRQARVRLIALLIRGGQAAAVDELVAQAESLPLPLGPAFRREAAAAMKEGR